MNTYLIIGIIVVAIAITVGMVLSKKTSLIDKIKKRTNETLFDNISIKAIDGCTNFSDIVGWFKSLKLDKEKDIPFIADPNVFKGILKFEQKKNVALFIGVYDENSDKIIHSQIIEADELDQKTLEVLGTEKLVVLS